VKGVFLIFFIFDFHHLARAREATGSKKRRNPAKTKFWKAVQPKPEVEFSRRPGDLTPRLRFPIRVPIHYWAYLLLFRLYPRELYHYAIVKATGLNRFGRFSPYLKARAKSRFLAFSWLRYSKANKPRLELFNALDSTFSLLSNAWRKSIPSHETRWRQTWAKLRFCHIWISRHSFIRRQEVSQILHVVGTYLPSRMTPKNSTCCLSKISGACSSRPALGHFFKTS